MEFVFVACKSVVYHVHRPVMLCYVSLCEGLCAGAGSLSYIVHVDCCGLSTIVIKTIIIIIITHDIGLAGHSS